MRSNPVDPFVRKLIQTYAGPNDVFLDIGCGNAPYKEWVPGKYIGLDVSTDDYTEGAPRETDIIGTADNIPLDPESVDVVFSKSAFFMVPDHKKALQEFLRVLRPGGNLILIDYNARTQERLQMIEGHRRYPAWSQWQLRRIVKRNGFANVRIHPPVDRDISALERIVRLLHQDVAGTWAIVTATKPKS